MYVRRKHCEYGRIKRSNRKTKTCDIFTNICGSYVKLFLIWFVVVALDFLMEFRFEYIWPCWLLLRSINDSFKYQGITFTVFFTMIALTLDFICFLLVPSSWLFLFGSTCVWMELVWHAERGVCAPTVAMCFIFLYVEVAVRLRDPKSIPFSIDLCRPFAAHCIGYPVVTLGFGLKSLLSHQLRLRRQHQVEKQNSKYFCLLELALPEDARTLHRRGELGNGQLATIGSSNTNMGHLALTGGPVTSATNSLPATPGITTLQASATVTTSTSSASVITKVSRKQQQQQNLANGKSASAANNCDHSLVSNHTAVDRKFFGFDGVDPAHQHQHQSHQHNQPGGETTGLCEAPVVSSSCSSLSGQEAVEVRTSKKSSANSSGGGGGGGGGGLPQGHTTPSSTPSNRSKAIDKSSRSGKDASIYRLEDELRRLRHERQTLLVSESELRSQLAQLTTLERTSRTETNQARQEVEYLQSKLTTVTQRLETERENLQSAEKKTAEEKRQRGALEISLAAEKRARREAENALKAAAPFVSMASTNAATSTASVTTSKVATKPGVGLVSSSRSSGGGVGSGGGNGTMSTNRCTSDFCAHRIHELEVRMKSVSRELSLKEAQLMAASQSNIQQQQQQQHHHQSCEQSHRIADLMIHLGDLEAENSRLKAAIKSDEKMKQELIAGYHNSLKEITELNSTLTRKEYQIVDLHMRLDMMNPNSPFNILFAPDASSGADGRGGSHPRTSSNFLNTTNAGGVGGSSLFPPRSADNDFDFGGGSGWPPFPTSSGATSVAFSKHPQQQHRVRSESTSAMLNALLSTGEDKSAIQPSLPPRFDTNVEVDLEAASSSLSPPEFLSKLRSQLAMAGAASGPAPQLAQPAPPHQQQQSSRDIVGVISGEPEILAQTSRGTVAETDNDASGGADGAVGETGVGKTGG